jgi:hypothetical protein
VSLATRQRGRTRLVHLVGCTRSDFVKTLLYSVVAYCTTEKYFPPSISVCFRVSASSFRRFVLRFPFCVLLRHFALSLLSCVVQLLTASVPASSTRRPSPPRVRVQFPSVLSCVFRFAPVCAILCFPCALRRSASYCVGSSV